MRIQHPARPRPVHAVIAAAMAASLVLALAVPAWGAGATRSLSLDLKLGYGAGFDVNASYKAGAVLLSARSASDGSLVVKASADVSHSTTWGSLFGSMAYANSASWSKPASSHSDVSLAARARTGKSVSPWQLEGKTSAAVRDYPFNSARNYVEGVCTAKLSGLLWERPKLSFTSDAEVGRKLMPGNPKWSSSHWASSAALGWEPAPGIMASAQLSGRGREYPASPGKSYSAGALGMACRWKPGKQHTLEFDVGMDVKKWAFAPAKDVAGISASASLNYRPLAVWSIDAAASLGCSKLIGRPDSELSPKASAKLSFGWEPLRGVKLTAGGAMTSTWAPDTDAEGDDEEPSDGVQPPEADASSRKTVTSLGLSARIGPVNGVTVDGGIGWKVTVEKAKGAAELIVAEPSADVGVSFKF